MLNYLGPQFGPQGPVSAQLPSATPGTMPQAIPGVPPMNAPVPMPHLHAAAHGRHSAPPHPAAIAAILHHVAASGGLQPPAPPEYGAITQSDGSIALHVKNHDGSQGPIVKIIPPIKRSGPA